MDGVAAFFSFSVCEVTCADSKKFVGTFRLENRMKGAFLKRDGEFYNV